MAAYITEEQLGTYWKIGDELFYIVREEGKVDRKKMISFDKEKLIHKVLPFVENGKQLVIVKCVVLSKNMDSTIYKLGILKEDGEVGREIEHDVTDGDLAQIYRNTYYQSMGKIHSWEVPNHIYTVKFLFHQMAESEKDLERFYKLLYSDKIKRAVNLEDHGLFKEAYVELFSEEDYINGDGYAQLSRDAILRALPL